MEMSQVCDVNTSHVLIHDVDSSFKFFNSFPQCKALHMVDKKIKNYEQFSDAERGNINKYSHL